MRPHTRVFEGLFNLHLLFNVTALFTSSFLHSSTIRLLIIPACEQWRNHCLVNDMAPYIQEITEKEKPCQSVAALLYLI